MNPIIHPKTHSPLSLFHDASARVATALCVTAAAVSFSAGTVRAQNAGSLDTTFGNGGKVSTATLAGNYGQFNELVSQTDGKIVAGGYVLSTQRDRVDFLVVRYQTDGTVDPSFGNAGGATLDFGGANSGGYIRSLAVQPDGKVLAAGLLNLPTGGLNPTYSFAVARFNADGSLDTEFGTNGKIQLRPGADLEHTYGGVGIVLQSDGKFVVAGATTGPQNSGAGGDFILIRFNSDGTMDPGFGSGGFVQTHLLSQDNSQALLYRIALQSDGKIVACGSDEQTGNGIQGGGVFLRYNNDGSLDSGFGSGGVLLFDQSAPGAGGIIYDAVTDLQIQPDGQIIGAGRVYPNSNKAKAFLVRIKTDGTVDTGFGSNGFVTSLLEPNTLAVRVRRQADGKYLVGLPDDVHNLDFELGRFNSDGSVDQSFGTNNLGFVDTDFESSDDVPYALLLQSDGKVIMGGYATLGMQSEDVSGGEFPSMVRYLTAASAPPFFAGEVALSQSVYYLAFPASGNIFGYYSFLSDPHYIYHFDLGYEYVFDANDNHAGVYLYDFASQGFFYTSPTFPFPYLYDFTLNSVVYYYPDPKNPGRYNTNGTRYFYVYNTNQIISK